MGDATLDRTWGGRGPSGTTRIATTRPPGFVRYKQTLEFISVSVPEALLGEHSVKAGVWGACCGYYAVASDTAPTVMEPEVAQHVDLLDEDSTFFVEFSRIKAPP
jgi:tellurite resistance-related uncharacterized protein